MARLQGKHAFITGAASGIGRATAIAFVREGATVTAADLDDNGLESLTKEIEGADGRVVTVNVDVSDWESVRAGVETGVADFGPVDIMFNCAGIVRNAMLHKERLEDFKAVVDVHLLGANHCLRAVIDDWIERRSGKMIFVTSPAAVEGQIGGASYSAAKAGVIGLMKAAARELARYNVNVNAIMPIAATPMTENARSNPKIDEKMLANIPLGRWAEPEEIVPGVIYLASDESNYVTGEVLRIDGGRSI